MPVVLGEGKGDRVFMLIHSEGRSEGSDNLRDECTSVLQHSVLEAKGEGYERLESALKELNGLLKGFLLSSAVREVHAVVGLLESGGVLHVSHVGRAEGYIIREGVATQITEYSRGKPPSVFMHIASGPVQERDHFLISTQRLLRSITPAQLSQTVQHAGDGVVQNIISKLSAEKEVACLIHMHVLGGPEPTQELREAKAAPLGRLLPRSRPKSRSFAAAFGGFFRNLDFSGIITMLRPKRSKPQTIFSKIKEKFQGFLGDLYDPERKRRAHLLFFAGSAALFLVIWMLVQLSLSSQRNQTRGELADLVKQINTDIQTADNRQLAGDSDSANAILARAEDRARQVMSNENRLFRSEALELLDRIKSKREEINRVIRLVTPRVAANLGAKKTDILAQGLIGQPNGEFIVYDRQNLYRVSSNTNTVEILDKLGVGELILDGVSLDRFQSKVFLTTGNSVIELAGGQPQTVKTEDPAGWVTGADLKTYLRYVYILSPERKQIYKYEHLAGKYGPPAEYNVNGDLTGAIDMTITGPIYILRDTSVDGKQGARDVVKLLHGEKQSFNLRNLPPDALNGVTKIFKSAPNGNFYFLDSENKRIVVTTGDGDLGDSLYLKQYILDSEQVGKLKDLYVDPEDTRLYVLDEKKLYAIDLQNR